MPEQLPISIKPSDELAAHFIKINSVANKLEAQFNFQTLTANWYGKEENILFIDLNLATPQDFIKQKKAQLSTQGSNSVVVYSDDVFSYNAMCEQKRCLVCCIAVTPAEINLLTEQPKVLASFMQVKLEKVLNLLAKQLALPPIT